MTDVDWDPRSAALLHDQIAAYDRMRAKCPVAYSDSMHWSLFRHADLKQVLEDHQTFSNAVSTHVAIPNGMDPPEHTAYRSIVEPYFGPDQVRAFEPQCRQIARSALASLPTDGPIEFMQDIAEGFAVGAQCAYMGWPARLHEPIRRWSTKNREATLSGDRSRTEAVAVEFDGYIRGLLVERRDAGDGAPRDVTTSLMGERIGERCLSDAEIVSILRNWTVGELGTISACVGILAYHLARQPELQSKLRDEPELLPPAIEEILRMDAPLIANRRKTTREVEIGGRKIGAGERLTLIWASANRDESVFANPGEIRLDRPPSLNLLYGAGIHACPGAGLARLELRVIVEELLSRTTTIALIAEQPAVRALYPAGGYSMLPIRVTARADASAPVEFNG